jgi:L-ascorbate metabolism protein UlaG (beta-lactamase superfamily)
MDGAVSATFTVLASGSSGNAALLRAGDFGLLIDLGIGPRTLERRLGQAGFCWDDIDAVVLTHTHGDHWRERSLAYALARDLVFYCHDSHIRFLTASSPAFAELLHADRVLNFEPGRAFFPDGPLRLLPIELAHDSHRTFGFRIELESDGGAAGYIADLGRFDEALVELLCDLDLLALEFNHDETMQLESGRPRDLIDRILGPHGHLSNRQAQALLQRILIRSAKVRPHSIVPLHLSRDCNHSTLAETAAHKALAETGHPATVVLSRHDCAAPTLSIRSRVG